MKHPQSSTQPTPDRPEDVPALDWLDDATLSRVREALAQRHAYRNDADGEAGIEAVQTHISSVFLTAAHVFKFKRPVSLGFVDFTRLADRERACRAEVSLNRRLAPDVYLDVLPLHEAPEGALNLDGAGRLVDWCVVMRRLPADEMLDARLRSHDVTPAEVAALADRLVEFHGTAQAGAEAATHGDEAAVRANWDENFRQTEPFVGDLVEAGAFEGLRGAVTRWLESNRALLAERVAAGHVRDGHGDLRCEHVYLPRGGTGEDVRIIDCIEFNDRFRYGDVANDLAFLLMDLVALGAPAVARDLLERYADRAGDPRLARLIPFYACYRAYVRFKVTALKSTDRNLDAPEAARVRSRAVGFFHLAQRFAEAMAPPVLVLIGGLMGTGKTALAEALARQGGVQTHAADALRKALAQGQSAAEAAEADRAGFGKGLYTPAWNARTYDALLQRGEAELTAGRSVILDASFARRAERLRATELARRAGARAVFVECRLDEARTRERLRRRQAEGHSLSDGREELYAQQRAAFEPVNDEERDAGLEHRPLDTGRPPRTLAGELLPDLRLPPPPFAGE